ncbi:DsbA family protein [Limosilactobacillus difficilis]|uniref:DsbA family protein n=1 Tax=Limosilactobacillus difficilis TaxID=2991838 RepID=UPI0024BB8BF5|nr:DsbA family protein [Limosilactobacillus difficilis]
MLEINLFVNPLGQRCFQCERDLLRMDIQLDNTINFQFIPLMNMKTIDKALHDCQKRTGHFENQQKIATTTYSVILDYKAALFQGRKRGRMFLLGLQKAMIEEHANYNLQLVKKFAQNAKLDLEMFMEDRKSPLAKQCFKKDQQLANQMGITDTATAIVVNTSAPAYGTLVTDCTYESLIDACQEHCTKETLAKLQNRIKLYH